MKRQSLRLPRKTISKPETVHKRKADINTKAKVNTYEGKNGLLYRVFPSKNNAFKCMDIVFDNKKNIAKA